MKELTPREKWLKWVHQKTTAEYHAALTQERKDWVENGLLLHVMGILASASADQTEFRQKVKCLAYMVEFYDMKEEANEAFLKITKEHFDHDSKPITST